MLRKLRPRSIYDVFALLALIVAVGGTSAYAANTVFSADIVDGEVKSVDIGNNEIGSADVKDNTLNTFDVHSFLGADVVDGSLTGADIADESIGAADIGSQQVGPDEVINDSLLQSDIRAGAVTGDEVLDGSLTGFDIQNGQIGQVDIADTAINSAKVADNSLTGADINESTLSLPPTTTASFQGVTTGGLPFDGSFGNIASRTLPAGSYALIATVNTTSDAPSFDDIYTVVCELRNGNGFIGGAHDRRLVPEDLQVHRTLTMSGGAQVPAGGGVVSLWCKANGPETVSYGHVMIQRLDGFF